MKTSKLEFDFAQQPLRYKIADKVKDIFDRDNRKPSLLTKDYDDIIYFKVITWKTNLFSKDYMVFYNDLGIVCPSLSPKQLKGVIEARRGYIAFRQNLDKTRGVVHTYSIKSLSRAHSLPYDVNIEDLINQNCVLSLN